MNVRSYKWLAVAVFAFCATALIPPPASAQRIATGGSGFGSRGRGFGHRGGRGYYGAGLPYFFPDYYESEPDVIEAPPARTIVMQSPPPAPAPQPPAEPLVLELQGDRWVRVSTTGEPAPGDSAASSSANVSSATPKSEPVAAAAPLPAALLVFRDGHQEEIGKYVIMGSTIYARADYWASGAWTRKVLIADLDVPATLRLNQQRGTQFRLPSGPNEVIMRP